MSDVRRGDLVTLDDGRSGFVRATVAYVPAERERPVVTRFQVTLFGGRGTTEMPAERLRPAVRHA